MLLAKKMQLCIVLYIPFGGEKSMDSAKPTAGMTVSSIKNSKILVIL